MNLSSLKWPAMLLAAFSCALAPFSASAQNGCDGQRYRYNSAFSDISVSYDVPYGSNVNALGLTEELVVDIYTPDGDIASDRALVLVAHGGFFLSGANDGEDVVSICEDLARMGYVVASMSYRLGVDDLFDLETSMVEAVWRGVHDSRAAVRYFRKTVEEDGNPYGIDPNRILLGGVSAGGFIALHHAYVDEDAEIPEQIDPTAPGLGGGLEGESGNPGYSSEVMGIFNVAGAIRDADWLSPGDIPLVSVHGTDDNTVPYGTGIITLTAIPIVEVDGSSTVHAAADAVGIEHCLHTLEGLDHVAHIGNSDAYDATISAIAGSMSGWLCDDWAMSCDTYDYTSDIPDFAALASWTLYPNPMASGQEIRWKDLTGVQTLLVADASGRQVMQQSVQGRSTATLPLPAGAYFVTALDGAGHVLGRPLQVMIQ
jgi:acetyl esterase/lipase